MQATQPFWQTSRFRIDLVTHRGPADAAGDLAAFTDPAALGQEAHHFRQGLLGEPRLPRQTGA
jgi:hypothetical protein